MFTSQESKKQPNNYVEYSNVDLKFVKAHSREGMGIINSMDSVYYHETSPDCILFSPCEGLEDDLSAYSLDRRQMDYSSDSGKYEIDAKYAVQFLDVVVKKSKNANFIISTSVLNELLAGLQKAGYITQQQNEFYQKAIKNHVTLEERGDKLDITRDFNEAINLAKNYKDLNSLYSNETSLAYLVKAFQFKPANVKISDFIDIDEFLKDFTEIYRGYIFSKDGAPLQEFLQRNKTIETIKFGTLTRNININENLRNYLLINTSLKNLDISATGSQEWENRLRLEHMRLVADGLKNNKTLENLNVSCQPIGDEGLSILLTALAQNPDTKLKSLNLYDTGITEKGQKALEAFLETNKTLQWVNLSGNSRISSTTIDAYLEGNKNPKPGPRP